MSDQKTLDLEAAHEYASCNNVSWAKKEWDHDVKTFLAGIAHRDQAVREMSLAWQNVSMLAMRMSRKKTIEGVQELFEQGKHLIYSNILRQKFESRGSNESK